MSYDESPTELRRRQAAHAANADNVRTLMRRPQPASGHGDLPQIPRFSELQVTLDHSVRHRIQRARLTGRPWLHPFIDQLLREIRRADRTKSPLSIVLFRFEPVRKSALRMTGPFCKMVERNCRETDIPARFGDDLVAILLLDTSEEGANAFRRKIVAHVDAVAVSAIAQTYPGHLFDNLVSGFQDPLDAPTFVPGNFPGPQRASVFPAALSMAKQRLIERLRFEFD